MGIGSPIRRLGRRLATIARRLGIGTNGGSAGGDPATGDAPQPTDDAAAQPSAGTASTTGSPDRRPSSGTESGAATAERDDRRASETPRSERSRTDGPATDTPSTDAPSRSTSDEYAGPETDGWPQVGCDAANTAAVRGTVVGTDPSVRWSVSVTPTPENGGVAVADGRCYVLDGGELLAVSTADGSEAWRSMTVSDPTTTTPGVADGRVFVGDLSGRVYAVDAASGEDVWHLPFQGDGPVRTPPTVADGVVYVGCSGEVCYAIDAESGTRRWEAAVAATDAPVGVADGLVYAVGDGTVVALVVRTGRRRFSVDAAVTTAVPPAVVDGRVYTVAGGQVRCIDATTGERVWSRMTGDRQHCSLAVGHRRVYAGGDDGGLVALSPDDGEEQWRTGLRGTVTATTVVGDVLYCGTDSGTLHALAAATGEHRWRHDLGAGLYSNVAVADGCLFVRTADGTVAAVDP